MSAWDDALAYWKKGQQYKEKLNSAKEHAEAAKGVYDAAAEARGRSANAGVTLSAEEALGLMKLRHGPSYPRSSPREMTVDEIQAAEWEIVEAWKAFRRLSLITNAIQWAFNKMIRGHAPIPDAKELLNALEAVIRASGDKPTRKELMEFWDKYCTGQLDIAGQFAKGFAEAGKIHQGGSLAVPSRRKMIDDALADDGTSR